METVGMDVDAPIGNVRNDAVQRRGAVLEPDLRYTRETVAWLPASLLKLLQHDARLHVAAVPHGLATAPQ